MITETVAWYRVGVPIASFAIPFSREFIESYPFPPPATVYGMLLSLIGETDRYRYCGTSLPIGVLGWPEMSWVLRKTRRFKTPNLSDKGNSKPDQVCLMTGLEFVAGIMDSTVAGIPSLTEAVRAALASPQEVTRYGGLSCGESHNLVDTIRPIGDHDMHDDCEVGWLNASPYGEWTVSRWVDHVGSKQTVLAGASFELGVWRDRISTGDPMWFVIQPE